MAVSVELPKLGLQAPPALLAEWYLPDGVTVHRGEALCRIETNNVAVEVEAEGDGVLRHRLEAGRERPAGDILGVILASGERMPELPPVGELPIPTATANHGPSEDEWQASVRAMRYWPPDATEPAGDDPEPPPAEPENAEPAKAFELVPFPRKAAPAEPSNWDVAPGDAADFASALLRPETPGPLPRDDTAVRDEPEMDAAEHSHSELGAAPETPDAVQAALSMRVTVDLVETHKLRAQLGREWRDADLSPTNADVVVRAVGRAAIEFGGDGSVALRTFDGEQARAVMLRDAGLVPFRQAVLELRKNEPGPIDAACIVSLFEDVDEAEPPLEPGSSFALAIGGERSAVRWDGERAGPGAELTLTLRCDPALVEPFEAARFLARVRELVEAPYALLVA